MNTNKETIKNPELYNVLPADTKTVDDVRSKITAQYKRGFSSSPIEIEELEIKFLIKFLIDNDCKCYNCNKSIFEMNDFPELLIEDKKILCEDCYDEQYRKACPICESYYDVKNGESEYSVKNEEDANDNNEVAGIYRNGNLIVPININYLKKIEFGDNCWEVWSDDICDICVSDLVRKDNFMKSHGIGTPCVLIKKYENDDLFKDYSIEEIKRMRQNLINKRITIRGIIEKANKVLPIILVGFFIYW